MCNAERLRRGFISNGSCPFCPGALEDRDHLFRKSTAAKQVWSGLLPYEEIQRREDMPFTEWFSLNLAGGVRSDYMCEWSSLFAITGVAAYLGMLMENGSWVLPTIEAECGAILKGLQIAWSRGYGRVIVETDSALVVKWLREETLPHGPLLNILEQCKREIGRQ
ncbi:hypothetical protein PTKIN_Ptkin14bG0107200 [Pterospermum kingtungense]